MISSRLTALVAAALSVVLLAAPATAGNWPGAPARPAAGCDTVIGNPAAYAGQVTGRTDPDSWLGNTSVRRPNVMMVGDSITAGGRTTLLRAHPTWEITAVPGRNVETLPCYVADRLRSRAQLDVVIIALGTNATTWWSYADYRDVVNSLPRRTRVVFVTTYRDPVLYSDEAQKYYRSRASVQPRYTQWMRTIESSRSGTCIADWRSYAEAHPTAMGDGTHPKGSGVTEWARIISAATAEVECLPQPTTVSAHVARVVDGDTVDVALPTGVRQRVSLIGVKAPTGGRCARLAEHAARDLLHPGARVTLVPGSNVPDTPGADALRYVVAGSGDVGRALARTGAARVTTASFTRAHAYRSAQREAQRHHQGLWGGC